MEEMEIVIVGGGIAGLATSLALHRKGIKSVVLERAESLRTQGVAISVQTNGWRALEQLGVAHTLRLTSLPILRTRNVFFQNGKRHESVGPASYGELRCVRRNDLVKALADALPEGAIRFQHQIVAVKLLETSSFPVLHIKNGMTIKAKVLIGCDGASSVVADFLRLNPTKVYVSRVVRGISSYPNGHGFEPEYVRIRTDNVLCARFPMTEKFVFWFIRSQNYFEDQEILKNQEAIAELTLGSIDEFSEEWKEMVRNCEVNSLYLSNARYRTPWEILLGKFRRGNVTVAGDAMHLMGPFFGQGGSAALEDAVVLARCFARKLDINRGLEGVCSTKGIEEAIDEYVSERRMRLVALSTQTYLTGLQIEASSRAVKLMARFFLKLLFPDQLGHTRYNCGRL